VDYSGVHGVYGTVIGELIVVPIAAFIAAANITLTVIDTAVIADVRTPIAVVPVIAASGKRPIRRGPERADVGSDDPHAGHPIVTGGSISPVTGRPEVIVAGTFGLGVLRDWRRWLFCDFGRLLIIGVASARIVIVVAVVFRSGLRLIGLLGCIGGLG
jgi:hypothetical protein